MIRIKNNNDGGIDVYMGDAQRSIKAGATVSLTLKEFVVSSHLGYARGFTIVNEKGKAIKKAVRKVVKKTVKKVVKKAVGKVVKKSTEKKDGIIKRLLSGKK